MVSKKATVQKRTADTTEEDGDGGAGGGDEERAGGIEQGDGAANGRTDEDSSGVDNAAAITNGDSTAATTGAAGGTQQETRLVLSPNAALPALQPLGGATKGQGLGARLSAQNEIDKMLGLGFTSDDEPKPMHSPFNLRPLSELSSSQGALNGSSTSTRKRLMSTHSIAALPLEMKVSEFGIVTTKKPQLARIPAKFKQTEEEYWNEKLAG